MSHSTSVKPVGRSAVAIPLLLVFILWAARALYFQEPWFALDDAYIYGHNAEVLLKGSDPNYGVSPLYGTTSAPFLLLLAGTSIFLPMGWALEVADLVGALLYVTATWRLARDLSPGWRMVAVAVALLSAMTIHQLTNGLETGLAMAAVMWAIVGMVERSRWLGLLTGLLPFIRPDLAPLAGMIWLTSADKFRHAALAALTATPFALWFLIETGFPVSLTGYAKQLFFNEASWPLARRLKVSGAGLGFFLIHMSATAIGLVLLPRRLALCLVVGILPYLVIGMLRFPSSFVMYQMRYFYPFLPFAVAGLILHGRKELLAAAAIVGLFFLPMWWRPTHIHFRDIMVDHLRHHPDWPRDHLPAGSKVLIHDAGLIAVRTDLRLTDVVGLKSPASIAALKHHQGDRAAALSEIAQGHDYLIELPNWNLAEQLRSQGWRAEQINPVESGIEVYRITPPGVGR